MTDDLLTALLRQQAQDVARALVKESGAPVREIFKKLLGQELRALVAADISPPQQPLPLGQSSPVAEHTPYRVIRFPHYTLLSVNRECVQPVAPPASKLEAVWQAIQQHLGDRECTRRQLTDDLATLGFNRTSLSPQITYLITRGALLHRTGHRIGEAYRG